MTIKYITLIRNNLYLPSPAMISLLVFIFWESIGQTFRGALVVPGRSRGWESLPWQLQKLTELHLTIFKSRLLMATFTACSFDNLLCKLFYLFREKQQQQQLLTVHAITQICLSLPPVFSSLLLVTTVEIQPNGTERETVQIKISEIRNWRLKEMSIAPFLFSFSTFRMEIK